MDIDKLLREFQTHNESLKEENDRLRKQVRYLVNRPIPDITRQYIARLRNENEKLKDQLATLKKNSSSRR
jgi:cell division septum initiation protein DivIVA